MVPNNVDKWLTEMEEKEAVNKLVGTPSTSRGPRVNSVAFESSSKYRLGLGAHINIMVTLNEPVIVETKGGKPTLKIQLIPHVTRNAKYESGSGSEKLLFRYTVGENYEDSSPNVLVPTGRICVPHNSAIENMGGISAQLNHPAAAVSSPPLEVTDEFDEVKVNEVVNTLSRSDEPTIIVEGGHDREIYEKIQDLLGKPLIDPLPVGGKDNLLAIYERREEFSSKVPVAFMADPDMWVLEDPHNMLKKYQDIIWTTGYSIENDLYADGDPISLIPPTELWHHMHKLDGAIRDFVKEKAPKDARRQQQYYAKISVNPALKLRGKDLLGVLENFCAPRPHLKVCKRIISTVRNHHPLLTRLVLAINTEIDKQAQRINRPLLFRNGN